MRLKSFQPFLICGFFAALPLLMLSVSPRYSSPLTEATTPLPFLMFAVLGFLSIKVNQTRLLFTGLALALTYGFVLYVSDWSWARLAAPWPARIAAVSLPLALLAVQLIPEGRIRGIFGATLVLSILVPLLTFAVAFHYGGLPARQWMAWHPALTPLPYLALGGVLAFGITSFFHRSASRSRIHRFILAGLVPVLLSLAPYFEKLPGTHGRFVLAIGFVCGAAILHYGIFLLYWERVYIDELTGIPNRRALDERLLQLGTGYSVAMVDIDHFKQFNDTYGHENGDMVLRYVATHLFKESGGRAYRYGGEEFTVVLPGVARDKATGELDRIRERLAARRFRLRTGDRKKGPVGGKEVQVTISVGVASATHPDQSSENVMKVADQALYEAKHRGRDCVVMAVGEAVKRGA